MTNRMQHSQDRAYVSEAKVRAKLGSSVRKESSSGTKSQEDELRRLSSHSSSRQANFEERCTSNVEMASEKTYSLPSTASAKEDMEESARDQTNTKAKSVVESHLHAKRKLRETCVNLPVGLLCLRTQDALMESTSIETLLACITSCNAESPAWSHCNIVKALQLLKPLKSQVKPIDWIGLTNRACFLLDKAETALRRTSKRPPATSCDLKNPSAELHEVLFMPRSAGCLAKSIASLGGDTLVFGKVASFLLKWLRVPGADASLDTSDLSNIVWAFSTQGAQSSCSSSLIEELVSCFRCSLTHILDTSETIDDASTHTFVNAFSGLARLVTHVKDRDFGQDQQTYWRRRLLPPACAYTLQNLKLFQSKQLVTVVLAFVKLGCADASRPVFIETLKLLSSSDHVGRFALRDIVHLAEEFYSLTVATCKTTAASTTVESVSLDPNVELYELVHSFLHLVSKVVTERFHELSDARLSSFTKILAKARISPIRTSTSFDRIPQIIRLEPVARPDNVISENNPSTFASQCVPQSELILVELVHNAKRKRLQVARSTTIKRLIEQYGKVVKGVGKTIIVDFEGVELSADLRLDMLVEEAAASPLVLHLQLDEWLTRACLD